MSTKLERYSVNKCPSVYDEYSFELSDLYRNVSEGELKETEEIRDVSLSKLRQWIANNPHIRKCRTDAKFLLRFLRFSQFSLPLACEAIEKYLVLREMYPKWYKNLDCNDPAMRKIFQSSFTSYLGQDSAGRSIIFFQYGRFDDQEISAMQLTRFEALIAETLLEMEEMQIGGVRVLVDYHGTTIGHAKIWDSTSLKIAMDAFSRALPIRYHDIRTAKLPKFAITTAEALLSCANPKFREKVYCYSAIKDLTEQFEDSMKPSIYGGPVDLEQLNDAFWEKLEKHRDVILGLDDMEIDIDYYSALFDQVAPSTDNEAVMKLFHEMEIK